MASSRAEPLMAKTLEVEHEQAPLAKAAAAAVRAAPAPMPAVMYAFIGVAAGANILFGFENSIISGARAAYASETGLDLHGAGYGFLASALPAGATVACLVAGFLQDFLGRRRTLALCCLAYIGAALVSFTSQSYLMLAAGRVLTGLSIGIFSSTAPMCVSPRAPLSPAAAPAPHHPPPTPDDDESPHPLSTLAVRRYIAELSPPAQRGQLVTVNQVCICTGVLLGYLASAVISSWRWQLFAATPLAAVLGLVFLFLMPFSPRWLMTKGRADEARAVLERLRKGEDEAVVAAELEGIRVACASIGGADAGAARWAKLQERHVVWSICIGVAAATMQQWSGVNAVNMYTSDVFRAAGFSGQLATQLPILIGVAKLVFVIVALFLMDRAGRKPLLLVGCAGMVVTLVALGFALRPVPVPRDLGIVATASLCLYMAFFEVSLGPVLWLLLSELFPLQVKGIAMSIGSFTCWLWTVAVAQAFSSMSAPSALGESGSFFFFAACTAASFVWIWFYVFETKGKSLEEIEDELRRACGGGGSADGEGESDALKK